MRNLVFLFVFIFSPVAIVSGNIGKTEIDKSKELAITKPISKTIKDELEEAFSDWEIAEASYYDPKDSKQTKKNPDGKGASGRMIESGSIALGSSFTEIIRKKSIEIFIEVENLKIVTPYGKGIFRVDDSMPGNYKKEDQPHIDFFYRDLNSKYKRQGLFNVKFRIYKIITKTGSPS